MGVSSTYRIGAEETLFDPPAKLSVKLEETDALSAIRAYVAVLENGAWAKIDASAVDASSRTVTAPLAHGGRYAVFSGAIAATGVGTEFRANGVTLASDETISAKLQATPGLVNIRLMNASPQWMRVDGLDPSHEYFVYRDSYKNTPELITSSAVGTLAFYFDGKSPSDRTMAQVLIQPHHGTVILPRDCTDDIGTRSDTGCDLKVPVDGVEISSDAPDNYFVSCLAGGGIYGSGSGIGVKLVGYGSQVAFCAIRDFSVGISVEAWWHTFDDVGRVTLLGVNIERVAVGITVDTPTALTVAGSRVVATSGFPALTALPLIGGRLEPPGIAYFTSPAVGYNLNSTEFIGDVDFPGGVRSSSLGGAAGWLRMDTLWVDAGWYPQGPPWDFVGPSGWTDVGTGGLDRIDQWPSTDVRVFNSTIGAVRVMMPNLGFQRPHSAIRIYGNKDESTAGGGIAVAYCRDCEIRDNTITRASEAISISGAWTGSIRNNHIVDAAAGVVTRMGNAATVDVTPQISKNTFERCSSAIRLEGGSAVVTENVTTNVGTALELRRDGAGSQGYPLVALNDFAGGKLYSDYDIDLAGRALSDSRCKDGQCAGNYWGHGCDQPAFSAGVDSNSASVTDSSAWGLPLTRSSVIPLSQLLLGGPPGCQTAACAMSTPTSVLMLAPKRR